MKKRLKKLFTYILCVANEMTTNLLMAGLDSIERKRQEYIKELITTEQAYIEDMRLVHEVFLNLLNEFFYVHLYIKR